MDFRAYATSGAGVNIEEVYDKTYDIGKFTLFRKYQFLSYEFATMDIVRKFFCK